MPPARKTKSRDTVVVPLGEPAADAAPHDVLVIEPDGSRRGQIGRGLRALGYRPHFLADTEDISKAPTRKWMLVLTGATLASEQLRAVEEYLGSLDQSPPPIRSLRGVYESEDGAEQTEGSIDLPESGEAASPANETAFPAGKTGAVQPWSEEFKIRVLRWAADLGPAVLRPTANPDAAVGHSFRKLEKHFHLDTGDAVRVLEDLADFGVLSRALSNRVHLCPHCRRWTINFREACTACRSLDVDIEGMIHHFACAYVGLEGEFRHGADLLCPKCGKELRHIGLDYERPRQTYVCRACERILEEPSVTTQCLGCGWEGMGGDVLPWAVFEYRLTARGHEAIERGELRGLKLREMIRTARYELASREFFELEVERETFRLRRYRRPMSLLVCRFTLGGEPYELFRESDEDFLRALSGRLVAAVRSLDVAALADATAVAVLLPETGPSNEQKALRRIERELSSLNMVTRDGRPIEPMWTTNAWEKLDAGDDEPILWFQQQLQSAHDGA